MLPPAMVSLVEDRPGNPAQSDAPRELHPAVIEAMKVVEQFVPEAAKDPHRPVCHFRPPARSMNDINGAIFHRGYYHVFYQYDPIEPGHKHWGHARSKDLVHWEHLPIALWPSVEEDEMRCYSGTTVINDFGVPMAFYTSIYRGYTERPRPKNWTLKVWAAVGDDDLIGWRKHPANPILDPNVHGGGANGYDPFIFQESGRTFMVLTTGSQIRLLEAQDGGFTKWEPRGVLVERPKDFTGCWECPNFLKLGERWLFLYSPSPKPVEYFAGSLDLQTLRFAPERHGVLDHGHQENGRFNAYATSVLRDDHNRRILFAWVSGFRNTRAWNGCMSLPRELSWAPDGRLLQQPVAELRALRCGEGALHLADVELAGRRVLEQAAGDTVEVVAVFQPRGADAVGLRLRRSEDGRRAITIRHDGRRLEVAGARFEAPPESGGKLVHLHVFLDKGLVEVFASGGRACATRVIPVEEEDLGVEVFAEGGPATLVTLDVWPLRPIW